MMIIAVTTSIITTETIAFTAGISIIMPVVTEATTLALTSTHIAHSHALHIVVCAHSARPQAVIRVRLSSGHRINVQLGTKYAG